MAKKASQQKVEQQAPAEDELNQQEANEAAAPPEDDGQGQSAPAEAAPPPAPVPPQQVEPAAPVSAKEEATDLPPDFPCRSQLIAAGYRTKAQVAQIGDLTAIPGIKAIHITDIRVACGREPRRR